MITEGHVDGVTSVAAANVATTSRTNAPPAMALAEKPKKKLE